MPAGPQQSDPPLTLPRADRKQRLVLACMADRAAWCQACEPQPKPPLALAGDILKMLEPLTFLLPGKIGRWLRQAEFLTSVGRQIRSFL